MRQDRCAMKVGTDGVLLASWARGGASILDIGTGTGVMALIMAQRFADADVTAIDIEPDACRQAADNFTASPFSDRLHAECSSLQEFHPERVFDAIVCNPPFFEKSLKNPDKAKATARHADSLPFRDLFSYSKRLLADDGEMSVIMPAHDIEQFTAEAYISGFFVHKRVWISTLLGKRPKRVLLSFTKRRKDLCERNQTLYSAAGEKSVWYKNLTDDFYL